MCCQAVRKIPLHPRLAAYESDPVESSMYPFATSRELKDDAFTRDLSAQILLECICQNPISELIKEILICQKMEASTKEQREQHQLAEHRLEPEPQPHFHKPHTITVRRSLTLQAPRKTTCRIKSRSLATNSKNFRTRISASSQRTL